MAPKRLQIHWLTVTQVIWMKLSFWEKGEPSTEEKQKTEFSCVSGYQRSRKRTTKPRHLAPETASDWLDTWHYVSWRFANFKLPGAVKMKTHKRWNSGINQDRFQETGLCWNTLWYLARSLSFIFQPILILKDCGASRRANSRLEAGFYTLCEPHVKKAIIFEHEAFRSNNPGCFLKLGAYRIYVFLWGTMFHFNWMVININDAEKHLARGEKNNNKPLGVRTERDPPRGTKLCCVWTNRSTAGQCRWQPSLTWLRRGWHGHLSHFLAPPPEGGLSIAPWTYKGLFCWDTSWNWL